MEKKSPKPEAEKEKELRRVIRLIVEEDLDPTSNPKDKYKPGSLKDSSESYIDQVTNRVEAAMADPNSAIRKKAQAKIDASFTN